MAYRWLLGYTLQEETPHFSTVSYNFRRRFTEETVDQVFRWILEKAVKVQIPAASRHYAKELMEEVNADREAHGKKPFDDDDEPPAPTKKPRDNTSRKKQARRKKEKPHSDPERN